MWTTDCNYTYIHRDNTVAYLNYTLQMAICLHIETTLKRIWTTDCNWQYVYTSGQLWSVYEIQTATSNTSIHCDNTEAYINNWLQLAIRLYIGTSLKRIWTTDYSWKYIYTLGQYWSVYDLQTAASIMSIHRYNSEAYMNYRLQLALLLYIGTILKHIWAKDCNWQYVFTSGLLKPIWTTYCNWHNV